MNEKHLEAMYEDVFDVMAAHVSDARGRGDSAEEILEGMCGGALGMAMGLYSHAAGGGVTRDGFIAMAGVAFDRFVALDQVELARRGRRMAEEWKRKK